MLSATDPDDKLVAAKNLTTFIYVLNAVGVFVFVASFVAIVINYVKKDDVKGTWLESHFRWQIRTFWISLFGFVVGFVTSIFIVGLFVLVGVYLWSIYRLVRGWITLEDGKEMYQRKKYAPALADGQR